MVYDDTLKTVRHSRQKLSQHEEMAAAAVDVGMLVEQTGSGVQPHSTAAEVGQNVLVAKERRSGGMEFGDSYPSGESVQVLSPSGGAGLNGLLATGNTVAHGDKLVSDGAGALRPLDTAGGDAGGSVIVTVDLKESSINRPSQYASQTQVDSNGASGPIAVPVEVI